MSDDVTRRAEQQIDRAEEVYDRHGKVFHVLWVVIGVAVVLAGIAMIVVPGPVTVVVPAGLAMLAVVFGWARRLLLKSVHTGAVAKERVEQASTKAKVLGALALVLLAAAVLVVVAGFMLT